MTPRLYSRRFERRLYLGLFLLLCAFVPVLAFSFLSLREALQEERGFVELRARQIELTGRLNADFEKQLSLMPVFVLTGHSDLLDEMIRTRVSTTQSIDELIRLSSSETERQTLRGIEGAELRHHQLGLEGIRIRRNSSVAKSNAYFETRVHSMTDDLRLRLAAYSKIKSAELVAAEANLARSARRTEIGLMTAAGLTLFFFALVSWAIVNEMRRKVRADREFALEAQRERELSQLRKETVDVVSHDLKNPMAALKLRIQLLARKGAHDSVLDRETSLALQSVNAMENLVRDLLDHAKIEAGRFAISRCDCQIGDLVEGSLARLGPLAQQKGIRFDTYIEPCFPRVQCDPARIAQVLDNLIGNALKFTPAGGHVRVSAAHQARQVMISVSDSGPGIPRENLSHVFERFWQAGETAANGTGLGLAISKGIVEGHGGRIWVESQPGQGAEFFFSLPLADAERANERVEPPAQATSL